MQFSVGVEYALHCLLHLMLVPAGRSVGVKELAAYQGVSETYLSKIFTKLRKSGVVKAVPGVKGGYELAEDPAAISFWDVVSAIEGASPMFQCAEIRRKEKVLDQNRLPAAFTECPCLIKVVMHEAEEKMKRHLQEKTLKWLRDQVDEKLPADIATAASDWFNRPETREK